MKSKFQSELKKDDKGSLAWLGLLLVIVIGFGFWGAVIWAIWG